VTVTDNMIIDVLGYQSVAALLKQIQGAFWPKLNFEIAEIASLADSTTVKLLVTT